MKFYLILQSPNQLQLLNRQNNGQEMQQTLMLMPIFSVLNPKRQGDADFHQYVRTTSVTEGWIDIHPGGRNVPSSNDYMSLGSQVQPTGTQALSPNQQQLQEMTFLDKKSREARQDLDAIAYLGKLISKDQSESTHPSLLPPDSHAGATSQPLNEQATRLGMCLTSEERSVVDTGISAQDGVSDSRELPSTNYLMQTPNNRTVTETQGKAGSIPALGSTSNMSSVQNINPSTLSRQANTAVSKAEERNTEEFVPGSYQSYVQATNGFAVKLGSGGEGDVSLGKRIILLLVLFRCSWSRL